MCFADGCQETGLIKPDKVISHVYVAEFKCILNSIVSHKAELVVCVESISI